jgi:uncharacterized protein YecE (DUF72 family)
MKHPFKLMPMTSSHSPDVYLRSITHYTRLKGQKPIELWEKFKKPLESIDKKIVFWLFQMPSVFKCNDENLDRIVNFVNKASLGNNAVMEFRDPSWWSKRAIAKIENTGICFLFCGCPRTSYQTGKH